MLMVQWKLIQSLIQLKEVSDMATWASGTFSKWSPSDEKDGDKGDETGNGKPTDQKGKPSGEGEGEGEGPGQEDVMKDIEKRLSGRNEIGSDEEARAEEEKQEAKKPKAGKTGKPGQGGMSDLESRKAEIEQIVPRMNWRSMIKQMVSSSVAAVDTSYAKPSRKSLTGITVAAQTGAGALKPGEKIEEQKHNKIALVFDTSGSMWSTIPIVLSEVRQLLKQLGKSNFPVTVIFFAGDAKWFQINLANNTYQPISGVADIAKPFSKKDAKPDYTKLITSAASGGTNFSPSLSANMAELAGKGFNVMIFSDSDLLYGGNYENLKNVWMGHKNNVFVIWDSVETWRNACSMLGLIPKTFTYLPVK